MLNRITQCNTFVWQQTNNDIFHQVLCDVDTTPLYKLFENTEHDLGEKNTGSIAPLYSCKTKTAANETVW